MPASRLVRALAEVLDAELRLPPVQFAERLGRLFDLTQSIAIASAHRAVVAADFEPECADGGALRQEFLSVRNGMVQSVVRSFDRADGTGRIRVPMASAAPAGDWAEDYAPYHRFYSAHQTDVDFRVRRLHALLRDGAAARSPQLARLCALDAALGDSIAGPARKLFAAIPRLLGQHFEGRHRHCRQQQPNGAVPDASWQHCQQQLCAQMQTLLLAEIEVRLLPSLGLLEAIDEAI